MNVPPLVVRTRSHPNGVRTTCLRFEDCDIAVSSQDESDLIWLAAFLDCGFEAVECLSSDYHVELRIDPTGYDRVNDGGRIGEMREGFAKDSNPALFERWHSNGVGRIFRYNNHPMFFVISSDGCRVEILARERSNRCRTALMRVVRELAMDRIVATGGTLVHGSAVRTESGVMVMCGPKRSGKTTLLMSVLMNTDAHYLSNDRCALRAEGDSATVRGIPTLVSIRKDTLDFFPAIRQRLASVRPDLMDPVAIGGKKRSKFSVSPPEFHRILGGCESASSGQLSALVFPQVTNNSAALTVRRLQPPEVLARFHRGLFRASKPTVLGEVFGSTGEPKDRLSLRAHASRMEQWVSQYVPCFDCQLGGGLPPGKQECHALLTAVTEQADRIGVS